MMLKLVVNDGSSDGTVEAARKLVITRKSCDLSRLKFKI